jgi:hypothetical protein
VDYSVASILRALLEVYRSWKFILLNIVVGIAYYYLFQYLILLSSRGLVIQTAPPILVYSLDLSASVVLTLSVYSVHQRLSKKRIEAGASSSVVGTGSILAAGITAGCACQAPILYSVLYFLGLNALEASGFVALVNEYQIPILLILILINAIVIFITLTRIQLTQRPKREKHLG